VFNRYFVLRAGRADRFRFWRAYQAIAAGAVSVPPALAARQIEQLTERSNSRFWKARDARSLRSNRYYATIRSHSLCGHVVRDFDPAALAPLLADPDAPFCRADVRVLKDSPSSRVVDFPIVAEGATRRIVYKRFCVRDRRDPWLSFVRRSAALRSWVFGQGLRERHLPTPRPLAVWHRSRNGTSRDGYLLTEHVDHAVDLHGFVKRAASLGSVGGPIELRRRADALARLLRDLHQRGLSHRDLKASNVLTGAVANDPRFWFIDLVGVRRHRRLGRPRKVQNLARLNASFLRHPLVTRTVRVRFLLMYINAGLHGTAGWKDWWRAVAAATEAKRAKNKKNGRPLD